MNFPKATKPNGFSLPEVTIAVGIAALGLVALLGLMPQGLEMARKTGELAAHRQIVEQITRDLEQTSWTDLQTLAAATAGQVKTFSDQGIEVVRGAANTSYVANVRVFDLTAQLPQGTGGGARTESFLRKVVTRIATTTNTAYNFDDPLLKANFSTFHTYVAKSL
jgi:uncharacterized protein (TIGR02598 family)